MLCPYAPSKPVLSLEGFFASFFISHPAANPCGVLHITSIEEVILEEERAELLQRIISKLPEMQRRRFLLHYEYEMTYKEIGKIEHCSQQSVGRAVTAAREKIKAEMKKYLNA